MVKPVAGMIDTAVAPVNRRPVIVSMTVAPGVTGPGLTPGISGTGGAVGTAAAPGPAGMIRPVAVNTSTLRPPSAAVDDTDTVSDRPRPSASTTGGLAAEI